jgi:hypothetical protein
MVRKSLTSATALKQVSVGWLVVALLVVFAAWGGTYCGGRGPDCRVPTTDWADSLDTPSAATPRT